MLRRPRTITANKTSPKALKPQKARQLIRRFHNLQKWKATILKRLRLSYPDLDEILYLKTLGATYSHHFLQFKLRKTIDTKPDPAIADANASLSKLTQILADIDAEVNLRGGLHVYQMASTVGQDQQRGGDSLKWLVKWFQQAKRTAHNTLEIGCLSVENAILACGGNRFGHVTRIDLNSQNHLILQQDFMERALPTKAAEFFDVISCSLVLNFVPSAVQRGQMLHRITQFLREPEPESRAKSALFLVLPLPCLSNSRYFDRKSLREIMMCLAFTEIHSHEAKKVVYLLYDWNGKEAMKKLPSLRKQELRAGASRNNFYIDMKF